MTILLNAWTVEIWGVTVNVPAQIIGFVAIAVMLLSYQYQKIPFLAVSMGAYALFFVQSGLLGGWSNLIINSFSFVRNGCMIFCLKKQGKELPLWFTFVLLACAVVPCCFYFSHWYDVLPPLLVILYTLTAVQKNYYVLKAGAFVLEFGFLIYYLFLGGYVNVVGQALLISSIVISVIRMKKGDKK